MHTGVCEIDGVCVSGKTKQINAITDRVDRRTINRLNKRVVISLRQTANILDKEIGVIKTKTFVLKSENTFDIGSIVKNHIEKRFTDPR